MQTIRYNKTISHRMWLNNTVLQEVTYEKYLFIWNDCLL